MAVSISSLVLYMNFAPFVFIREVGKWMNPLEKQLSAKQLKKLESKALLRLVVLHWSLLSPEQLDIIDQS